MVCQYASNTYESMLDLSLHIVCDTIGSVTSALHSYTQPEYLDGDNKYKCDKCKQYVRARRVRAGFFVRTLSPMARGCN